MPEWEAGAIDGTIMNHNNRHYFVWASWIDGPLKLYIAPMADATSIGNPKVLLKEPTEEWECRTGCVNEGPFFIYNRNVSYMIFSASSTWDPNYCLSQMSIEEGRDPLSLETGTLFRDLSSLEMTRKMFTRLAMRPLPSRPVVK